MVRNFETPVSSKLRTFQNVFQETLSSFDVNNNLPKFGPLFEGHTVYPVRNIGLNYFEYPNLMHVA